MTNKINLYNSKLGITDLDLVGLGDKDQLDFALQKAEGMIKFCRESSRPSDKAVLPEYEAILRDIQRQISEYRETKEEKVSEFNLEFTRGVLNR